MSKALDVDWSAVRVLAVAVGVREAARRMGIGEDTVCQRSARENWLQDVPEAQRALYRRKECKQPVSTTPASAMADVLKEDSRETRLGHSRFSRKVADDLNSLEGRDERLAAVGAALQNAKAASLVHGWSGSNGQSAVRLDVLAGAGAAVRLEFGPSAAGARFEDDEEP